MMKQAQGDCEGTDFEAGAVQTTTNLKVFPEVPLVF